MYRCLLKGVNIDGSADGAMPAPLSATIISKKSRAAAECCWWLAGLRTVIDEVVSVVVVTTEASFAKDETSVAAFD